MLDTLTDLVDTLVKKEGLHDPSLWGKSVVRTGSLYCPSCGANRKMAI